MWFLPLLCDFFRIRPKLIISMLWPMEREIWTPKIIRINLSSCSMNSVKKLNRIATHAREVLIYVILNTIVRGVKKYSNGAKMEKRIWREALQIVRQRQKGDLTPCKRTRTWHIVFTSKFSHQRVLRFSASCWCPPLKIARSSIKKTFKMKDNTESTSVLYAIGSHQTGQTSLSTQRAQHYRVGMHVGMVVF